ncbi:MULTISPECIES: hypothetical protein [Xanthomonas]|uniref:Uncharacterized protein n=1 Tax=Xanthomonas cucurbitae TaxID=56453 RepID=A0A2S7DFZ4_9XANT|nr:hypothetical protein [Xanthomonas cucurbitae]PPU72737.1 hypothetical protein XcuCFBP2542_17110 [Xanthomonas cucurbitae]QHG87582.1 hypothetical protein EBN15_12155 [Xanthomonas cucurbitae]WDM66455.1 hypothetical protein K6981_12940 [Xanthomonas cucurbitae]WDM70334.1 hypothetical protein K6978_12910 [Xanthomonas cucurbitae]WDM74201.1 hypothetical protein K6982_12230 [Xanthomonas cucurbitae]
MPVKPLPFSTPSSPAQWQQLQAAAAAELARRTAQAHLQILGILRTHGHLLSAAQRRSLHKRLQRGRR